MFVLLAICLPRQGLRSYYTGETGGNVKSEILNLTFLLLQNLSLGTELSQSLPHVDSYQ